MAGKIHRNSLKPGHKVLWYEIKEVLAQMGLHLGMEIDSWPPENIDDLAKRYDETNYY